MWYIYIFIWWEIFCKQSCPVKMCSVVSGTNKLVSVRQCFVLLLTDFLKCVGCAACWHHWLWSVALHFCKHFFFRLRYVIFPYCSFVFWLVPVSKDIPAQGISQMWVVSFKKLVIALSSVWHKLKRILTQARPNLLSLGACKMHMLQTASVNTQYLDSYVISECNFWLWSLYCGMN